MAGDLKGRLARIRKLGLVKAAELGKSGRAPTLSQPREKPSFLESWEKVGDFVWTRTVRFETPFPESLDPAAFAPLRRLGSASAAALTAKVEASERISSDRLLFFDLETTGLSGGTGTLAFLAAVGRIDAAGLALTQLFLEDFPGEGLFIEALLKLFGEDIVMVSYNGRAFDMPLLRTRCVMNAISPPAFPHFDALFASRRLWRRVHGGASLGVLEREVLGIERKEDLPGAFIPEAWLGFARTGDGPLMPLVLSHNADDVVALARLSARIQGVFDDPRSHAGRSDIDRAGLGRSLLAIGRIEEGEELLEAALGDGDERAGLLLSHRYRVARRVDDALRVVDMLPDTYRSAMEKALLYERLIRDPSTAAQWAKQACRMASGDAESEEAGRRLERLERRLARESMKK
jgi:hypothetical protein